MADQLHRHYDSKLHAHIVRIAVGECHVSSDKDVISTVLGSCIAACISDPSAGVGGMNHFMLPGCGAERASGDQLIERRYGAASMEVLINSLLARGASKDRMEVKLFGGAELLGGGISQVGRENARFAHDFVQLEGLQLVASDCGGPYPRRVQYWPATGKAMVMHMPIDEAGVQLASERKMAAALARTQPEGDIELFS